MRCGTKWLLIRRCLHVLIEQGRIREGAQSGRMATSLQLVTQQDNVLEAPLPDLQDVERQLAHARTLFPSLMESASRRDVFQQLFLEVCDELPSNKHTICSYLNLLRHSLIEHYSKVESTLPHSIDLTASKDDIYDHFRETLSCSQELDFILTFIPDIRAELRRNLKRPRAESTNGTGIVAQKRR